MNDAISILTVFKTVSLEHRAITNAALFNASHSFTEAETTPVTINSTFGQSFGMQQAIKSIQGLLQNHQRELVLRLNEDVGLITITVVDQERQQIIREIPSEQALKLIA
ncbi:flagellar protein FlaG [Chromatium okenii]|jgi:uncharacterized FlaG/YvyC family protein|uniref:Flagellar biosynthesis protein FlaG n=1 Tax=Chromatium okenii TaxID=61644 RepID=A0A2S7XTH8_9GAMM|nr:flagellar protein FlaG [Chromatium okenii]MBV5311432.1 flagellar protein FlaG [Chromatium okenii]PQJ97039.1 hypothetical protein CXB77_03345 [Chromatium okenii]